MFWVKKLWKIVCENISISISISFTREGERYIWKIKVVVYNHNITKNDKKKFEKIKRWPNLGYHAIFQNMPGWAIFLILPVRFLFVFHDTMLIQVGIRYEG